MARSALPLDSRPGSLFFPPAAHTGPSAIVPDCRQGKWLGPTLTESENTDTVAARLDGWRPLDVDAGPVAASPQNETRPALASGGGRRWLVVYEKRLPDGGVQVVGRVLQTEP